MNFWSPSPPAAPPRPRRGGSLMQILAQTVHHCHWSRGQRGLGDRGEKMTPTPHGAELDWPHTADTGTRHVAVSCPVNTPQTITERVALKVIFVTSRINAMTINWSPQMSWIYHI